MREKISNGFQKFSYIEFYMSSKSLVNCFVWKPSILLEHCIKLTFSGCPQKFYHGFMYIVPSSGHALLNLNLPFFNWFLGLRLFSDVWSENDELFERLIEIYSNPPIQYYTILQTFRLTSAYQKKIFVTHVKNKNGTAEHNQISFTNKHVSTQLNSKVDKVRKKISTVVST